jgi:hypothetical protein
MYPYTYDKKFEMIQPLVQENQTGPKFDLWVTLT